MIRTIWLESICGRDVNQENIAGFGRGCGAHAGGLRRRGRQWPDIGARADPPSPRGAYAGTGTSSSPASAGAASGSCSSAGTAAATERDELQYA